MGEFPCLGPEIGNKEDEEGLDYQGDGDQDDIEWVGNNRFPLEREDDDECQQQPGYGYIGKSGYERFLKVLEASVFGNQNARKPPCS